MLYPNPLYSPPALLPNSPTPAFWPCHSLLLGHMIFTRPRASSPIDGRPGHPLLHMQLETCALGVLVSSDPFSSLGTCSNYFIIRGNVSLEHHKLIKYKALLKIWDKFFGVLSQWGAIEPTKVTRFCQCSSLQLRIWRHNIFKTWNILASSQYWPESFIPTS
jgi:hypothetical protein